MKNNSNDKAISFNINYTDIVAGAKLIQEQLKNNISFAKKLGRKAKKLYDYGNKKCYKVSQGVIHPIAGIKKLDDKMDLLEQLTDLYVEIEDLVEMFDIEVK